MSAQTMQLDGCKCVLHPTNRYLIPLLGPAPQFRERRDYFNSETCPMLKMTHEGKLVKKTLDRSGERRAAEEICLGVRVGRVGSGLGDGAGEEEVFCLPPAPAHQSSYPLSLWGP